MSEDSKDLYKVFESSSRLRLNDRLVKRSVDFQRTGQFAKADCIPA